MEELEKNLRAEIARLSREVEDLKQTVNIQATVIRIVQGTVELLPYQMKILTQKANEDG